MSQSENTLYGQKHVDALPSHLCVLFECPILDLVIIKLEDNYKACKDILYSCCFQGPHMRVIVRCAQSFVYIVYTDKEEHATPHS